MGNEKSTPQHNKPYPGPSSPKANSRIVDAFHRLTSSGQLTFDDLKQTFGEDLAESLWDYLSDKRGKDGSLSLEEFTKHAYSIIGENKNLYACICQPERHLIKVCSEAAGVTAFQGDEVFIASLEEDLKTKSCTSVDIVTWINLYAPRLCEGVHSLVLNKLCDYPRVVYDYASDILSPIEMWFVKCSLPNIFFPKTKGEISQWSLLYSSSMQGISVNRFDANVVDYRGATVTIFQLTDKRKLVLASDQEWRHSSNRFGGLDTTLLQIAPSILRVQSATNSIYCNFKLRAAVFGLSFKEIMKIDKDMSNVQAIEVWGCSGANTLAEQQKLKLWQSQQAERHKKVPLPGNWDDNPDKTILEMAGFQFSNERKLMEMEAQKK